MRQRKSTKLLKKTFYFSRLVPKRFWARPKSEFGDHLVTHASNNVWKKYWLRE